MSLNSIYKAFGMPTADETHQYIYKSGEYGTLYQYWYRDSLGNYYRYTNAPIDTSEFDPFLGQPLMDPEQPLPEKTPAFFTPEGFKRHMAVPEGGVPTRNPSYNQTDLRNIWFEAISSQDTVQYIYLDSDVKENIDLYVQNQLRVVDAGLSKFRAYATQLFTGSHVKDRITGAILMLVDQGFYSVEELVDSTVGDIEFIDQAVVFLGRKFVCDLSFLDFLTSLVALRPPVEPLFVFDTLHGKQPVGRNYIYSIFASLRVSPKFLLYWNASHMYSRIVNRLAFQQIPQEEVESVAFEELARTLTTRDDVRYLVDFKVRVELLRNYQQTTSKSLSHLSTDDFGIAVVRSDLTSLREDEKEFSSWLQAEPMHDTSPAEQEQVLAEVQTQQAQEAEVQPQPASPVEEAPPTKPEEAPE